MGRLIDEEELKKYIMHDGCDKGCGYIDERDLKYVSLVEAIPKAEYEARLKADMVDILTELQLEIEELNTPPAYQDEDYFLIGTNKCSELIQQKIDKYKAESVGEKCR